MKRDSRTAVDIHSDRGAVAVTVAVTLIVLLGVAALAVDAGAVYAQRRQLQTAADAAALAGAQELPDDPAGAIAVAEEYAKRNTADADQLTFQIESRGYPNDTIVATVRDPDLGLFFARFLRIETAAVEARAVAAIESPYAYSSGVMPMGILPRNESDDAPWGYDFNTDTTLKQGGGGGTTGNYQWITLSDPPAVGEDNEKFAAADLKPIVRAGGCSYPVYITYRPDSNLVDQDDRHYNVAKGEVTSVNHELAKYIGEDDCSFETVVRVESDGSATILDHACPRVVICPMIGVPQGEGLPLVFDLTKVNPQDGIEVIGFAYFFVTGTTDDIRKGSIDGKFIRPLTPEELVKEWGPYDGSGPSRPVLVD